MLQKKHPLFLVVWLFPFLLSAQDGTLDNTFGLDGIAQSDLGEREIALSIRVQPDGKIVTGGMIQEGPNQDFAICRYNADGSFDNTFDGDGTVQLTQGYETEAITDIRVLSDGRILAAGHSGGPDLIKITVIKLLPNGALDDSFGEAGISRIDVGLIEMYSTSMMLLPDGKIIIGARGLDDGESSVIFMRLMPNGEPDTGFSSEGFNTWFFGNESEQMRSADLQSDGKIIGAGQITIDNSYRFFITRFETNGYPDIDFGTNGIIVLDLTNNLAVAFDVYVLPDDKILVTGFSTVDDIEITTIVRLNSNGSLDTSFGDGGVVYLPLGTDGSFGLAAELQTDGKILVCGWAQEGLFKDIALTRLLSDGTPDNTFGTGGTVFTPVGKFTDYAPAIAIQQDAKILVTASVALQDVNFPTMDEAVLRYRSTVITNALEIHTDMIEISVFPNPTTDNIHISYTLESSEKISIGIYDVEGKKVSELCSGVLQHAGTQSLQYVLPGNMAAGKYFIQISNGSWTQYAQLIYEAKK